MSRRREQEFNAAEAPLTATLLFAVFVLVGVAFISTSKMLAWHPYVVTLGPVLLMLVYVAANFGIRSLRLRDDQAGDNCYYMGFLFTLTSLGVSLYQFSADGGADQIVRNFGVAVGSTIAGVALRVVINQMRRDPVEVEAAARSELADASRRVRTEMDSTVQELGYFRRATQQALLEGFQEIARDVDKITNELLESMKKISDGAGEAMERTSTESVSALKSMSEEMLKTLGDASEHLSDEKNRLIAESTTNLRSLSDRIAEDLEVSGKRLSEENNRLASGASDVVTALEGMTSKLSSMEAPEKVIEIRAQPIVDGFRAAVEDLDKSLNARTEESEKFIGELASATERREEEAQRRHSEIMKEQSDLADALARTLAGLDKSAEALQASGEAMRSSTETVEALHDRMSEEFRGLREGLASVAAKLEALPTPASPTSLAPLTATSPANAIAAGAVASDIPTSTPGTSEIADERGANSRWPRRFGFGR